ncbi:MAG: indole-3-glycerol phosphate synthase TrpC [Candidatus Omnitrophota bacterium]|nr:indole-3-glycerol phosphate synthase TrpC [Candidatus Omnitrophota bacterium]MBU1928871.1 indole-3-glycerol phosphate synthase TrpC [Candidatus Omnitrophota bacterium]MBU2034481.1 indole-3-glycerol phosphate synthase TrpC [Candidatus Omnitrophota bacterium]MBU2221499.1 indole-3-glycerol phosphate synthase TrpC [Candidatus Omnitrophota bacterium]MBU2258628.1 indole-3-glycerol phosphate synthase TrpC [Candidatus Omnitrophota bacterium]
MKKTDCLKDIVAKKKERLVLAKQALPEEELKNKVQGLPAAREFIAAINKPKAISLIAEIKKQSPSQGLICQEFIPADIARVYKEAGAQGISVLTEEDFFAGNLNFINEVKSAVDLPVLRKDFIIEAYQVYESRFFGADAILLIADLLSKDKISEFMKIADSLGMDCLVEAHTEKELKKVLDLKVPLIGINNRDLHTLEVDPKITERLITLVPKDKVVVVESGLKNSQDILFLKILGVKAVLIGESILRADDRSEKIKDLMGW